MYVCMHVQHVRHVCVQLLACLQRSALTRLLWVHAVDWLGWLFGWLVGMCVAVVTVAAVIKLFHFSLYFSPPISSSLLYLYEQACVCIIMSLFPFFCAIFRFIRLLLWCVWQFGTRCRFNFIYVLHCWYSFTISFY